MILFQYFAYKTMSFEWLDELENILKLSLKKILYLLKYLKTLQVKEIFFIFFFNLKDKSLQNISFATSNTILLGLILGKNAINSTTCKGVENHRLQ